MLARLKEENKDFDVEYSKSMTQVSLIQRGSLLAGPPGKLVFSEDSSSSRILSPGE